MINQNLIRISLIIIIIIILKCTTSVINDTEYNIPVDSIHKKPTENINNMFNVICDEDILFLLERNNYDVYLDAKKIPEQIILSISKQNNELFRITDSSNSDSVNLSDIRNPKYNYYYNVLLFLIVMDEEYILCYKSGGFSISYIIEYFNFKLEKHIRYQSLKEFKNVNELKQILLNKEFKERF